MKGGSVASSAVEQLVAPKAFENLNVQFDNIVGGAKKSVKKTTTKKTEKKTEKKTAQKTKQQGGVCMMCGGMKHINDFDDEGLFNLYNKKGGSQQFTMNYDYSASMLKPLHGAPVDRVLNTDVVGVMANDSSSTLGSMSKTVEFGNVFGTRAVPFNYSGGSQKTKKQVKKSPSKKTATPKKTAEKKK